MSDEIRQSFVVTRTIKIKPNYAALARCHPDLERGLLRCANCGAERTLSPRGVANAFARGWPKCCFQTMTLVSGSAVVQQEAQTP